MTSKQVRISEPHHKKLQLISIVEDRRMNSILEDYIESHEVDSSKLNEEIGDVMQQEEILQ